MASLSDYALSVTIVVGGCFAFWMWKVTSPGGTIADGAYVALTWAIPAAIVTMLFTRSINRGEANRSPQPEEDAEPLVEMPTRGRSPRCASCHKAMRYSFGKREWVCDKCQVSRHGSAPIP